MESWEMGVMGMIVVCAVGFLLSDGERRRVRWIRAMRRCMLRMNGIIRYEQPGLSMLLRHVDLSNTQQERELSKLLCACADKLDADEDPNLMRVFICESARMPSYGVLSAEDRQPFEAVIGELGRAGMPEQIRLIDEADENLRQREETLSKDCARRMQMIRTLSLAGGAAVFLILI